MKKKLLLFTGLALSLCLLCSCAGIIEGEYTSSQPHQSAATGGEQTSQLTLEVTEEDDIIPLLTQFVKEGVTYGTLRFTYEDGVEDRLSRACIEFQTETPLGAYAVKYLSYSLNRIVSYYEADISIIYSHTLQEIENIKSFSTFQQVSDSLLETMGAHQYSIAFTCDDDSVTEDTVKEELSRLYYENPDIVTYLPDSDIYSYPQEGFPRIIQVDFSYPYGKSATEIRAGDIEERLSEILAGGEGLSGDGLIRYFSQVLRENVEFDSDRELMDDFSPWHNVYTAYGALVMDRAVGEGYAMAMKMLCQRADISCWVVRGRLNNVSHSWNIVELENGNRYHLDCTMEEGRGIFFTDSEMSDSYWWDSSLVPECNGPSLIPRQSPQKTITPAEEPAQTEEPTETPETEVTDEPSEPAEGDGGETSGDDTGSEGETDSNSEDNPSAGSQTDENSAEIVPLP